MGHDSYGYQVLTFGSENDVYGNFTRCRNEMVSSKKSYTHAEAVSKLMAAQKRPNDKKPFKKPYFFLSGFDMPLHPKHANESTKRYSLKGDGFCAGRMPRLGSGQTTIMNHLMQPVTCTTGTHPPTKDDYEQWSGRSITPDERIPSGTDVDKVSSRCDVDMYDHEAACGVYDLQRSTELSMVHFHKMFQDFRNESWRIYKDASGVNMYCKDESSGVHSHKMYALDDSVSWSQAFCNLYYDDSLQDSTECKTMIMNAHKMINHEEFIQTVWGGNLFNLPADRTELLHCLTLATRYTRYIPALKIR